MNAGDGLYGRWWGLRLEATGGELARRADARVADHVESRCPRIQRVLEPCYNQERVGHRGASRVVLLLIAVSLVCHPALTLSLHLGFSFSLPGRSLENEEIQT